MTLLLLLWACQSEPSPAPKQALPVQTTKEAQQSAEPTEQEQKPPAEIIEKMIYLTVEANLRSGQGDFLKAVSRSFSQEDGPQKALEQLYSGPTSAETGLVLTTCGTTGADIKSIEDGFAYVQLKGECGGCGAHSIYDSIQATLKEWPDISGVVAFGPDEQVSTSIKEAKRPRCLEP